MALGAITSSAYALGFRYNHTDSLPHGRGIWLMDDGPVVRGSVVSACLPKPLLPLERNYIGPGFCPSWAEPVLKLAAAMEGDVVWVMPDGIWVNGARLPDSKPLHADPSGRPLRAYPQGIYRVEAGQVWLVNPAPLSYDARYFGPLPLTSVRGSMSKIWTW